MKQLKLFREQIQTEFGGSLNKSKRKVARPLNPKLPTHLVLKATNPFLLLKDKTKVEKVLRQQAHRAGVRLYDCGVHADHIHLAALFKTRQSYVRWIRAITSILVRQIHGLKWRLRPYTRISAWGKAFNNLKAYIGKNRAEGKMIVEVELVVGRFARSFWSQSNH